MPCELSNGEEPKCKRVIKSTTFKKLPPLLALILISIFYFPPKHRVYKNTHPEWTKTFTLNYEYGSECYFYVQVFRLNHGEEAVSFGNAVCEIGDILGSKNHTKVKRLPKGGV
jgi:hypothetical protein